MIGLSAGRAFAFIVTGWLGLIVVASCQTMLPRFGTQLPIPAPDVVLLLVLFVGLSSRGAMGGVCALAIALGYLSDLLAGSPKGVHMIAFALLGLAVRAASSRLLVRGALYTALVAAFYATWFGVLVVGLRVYFDPVGGASVWGILRRMPLAVLSTSLCAPIAFAVFRRIDRLFTRDPRALPRAA